TKEDVIAAFRAAAKKVHPDVGGTDEQFCELLAARDRLLAALGTSAPAPKMPTYAPSGDNNRLSPDSARYPAWPEDRPNPQAYQLSVIIALVAPYLQHPAALAP